MVVTKHVKALSFGSIQPGCLFLKYPFKCNQLQIVNVYYVLSFLEVSFCMQPSYVPYLIIHLLLNYYNFFYDCSTFEIVCWMNGHFYLDSERVQL